METRTTTVGQASCVCAAVFREEDSMKTFRNFQKSELSDVVSQVGFGGFGRVFHRKWRRGVQVIDVAEKVLIEHRIEERYARTILQEAEMLCMIKHQHVVKLFGVKHTDCSFSLIMEFVKHGSCTDFFKSVHLSREHLWKLKYRIALQVSGTMEYLHTMLPKRMLHLDLKSANVLLDATLNVKLCDFGLSQVHTLSRLATRRSVLSNRGDVTQHHVGGGTITHMAPEHLANPNYKPTTKSDIYSYSVFLWELVTERQPYENVSHVGDSMVLLKDHIVKGSRPDASEIPPTTPTPLITVIHWGWNANPNARPEFQDITRLLRKSIVYEDSRLSELVSDILVAWVPQTTTTLGGRSDTPHLRSLPLFDTGFGASTLKSKEQYRSVSRETESASDHTYTVIKPGLNNASTATKCTVDSGLYSTTLQSNRAEISHAKHTPGCVPSTLATEATSLIPPGSARVVQQKSFCESHWPKIVAFLAFLLVLGGAAVVCVKFLLKPETGPAECAKRNGQCIQWNYDICYGTQSFGICTASGKQESCCVTTDTDRLNEDKWRINDEKCRSLGGNCQQDSNSCSSEYGPLTCGGPNSRKCCLGRYSDFDINCTKLGGYCVDWRYHKCTAGYKQGLCGGNNNRRCCLYCDYLCYSAEEKYRSLTCDDPCKHRGGTCKNSTNYCKSEYMIGLCCGKNGRSCCLDPPTV